MGHGTPDWGQTAGAITTYQLTDLGELAARLGSIDTFDRRGDVIWFDDFECGLNKWGQTLLGADASVALSTVRARNGLSSALLTAGSDDLRSAYICHEMPLPVLGGIGFEQSFLLPGTIDNLGLTILTEDGVTERVYTIRWRDFQNDLQYYDADADWITFASGLSLWHSSSLFHMAKLVVDTATGEYVRFLLDDSSYSLTGISARASASGVLPRIDIWPQLQGRAGNNDQVYLDDTIVTQNEPV